MKCYFRIAEEIHFDIINIMFAISQRFNEPFDKSILVHHIMIEYYIIIELSTMIYNLLQRLKVVIE